MTRFLMILFAMLMTGNHAVASLDDRISTLNPFVGCYQVSRFNTRHLENPEKSYARIRLLGSSTDSDTEDQQLAVDLGVWLDVNKPGFWGQVGATQEFEPKENGISIRYKYNDSYYGWPITETLRIKRLSDQKIEYLFSRTTPGSTWGWNVELNKSSCLQEN